MRSQVRIELVEDETGFNAGPSFRDVHLEHRPQVFRGVDDEARSNRLTRLRCAAAAHRDRAAESHADANETYQVVAQRGTTTPSGSIW